uniref:Uncharacterized protein n=1 Tax=Anguilla anguilla TaxID=7936 RepID=A0A0E9QJN8_ANGAN
MVSLSLHVPSSSLSVSFSIESDGSNSAPPPFTPPHQLSSSHLIWVIFLLTNSVILSA